MNTQCQRILLLCSLGLTGCNSGSTGNQTGVDVENAATAAASSAAVTAVSVAGESRNFSFSVTIESPDTGCTQYADWWEVLSPNGELIYRRILTHSHVDEQPFTRSGSPVEITAIDEVIVRAHMNSVGYGSQVFRGSVEAGFSAETVDSAFAEELEISDPLPNSCAF